MDAQILQHRSNNPETFWREQAENIHWFTFPKTIISKDKHGLYRWYKGGKLNTCFLAVDNNILNGLGEQVAIHYDSPVTNTKKSITYNELHQEVKKMAGVLKELGVEKGDRVIIYMSLVPEAIYAMLACARLGAVHSVVFGGFSSTELSVRIDDCTPKVLIMTSGGKEFDKVIPYKKLVDEAIEMSEYKVPTVVCLQRDFVQAPLIEGRDHDYHALISNATPVEKCTVVDATDPLYILYTSGTTGKPKGVVRDNGGHAVAMKYSMKYCYGSDSGDVFWASSDIGWAVGHSYMVYAPLMSGCTTIMYEGKPVRTPDAGAFWRVISEYKVKIFFVAPTAIRAVKKEDPTGSLMANYNLEHFKYIFVAGERCDTNTLEWLMDNLKRPAIDHWWQTESGYPMLSQLMGLTDSNSWMVTTTNQQTNEPINQLTIKPGSAGKPVPGFDIRILDENQNEMEADEEGAVCIKYPLAPGCLPTLWNDIPRFKEAYLSQFPGYYFTGDGGYKDADGYVYITGRIDDVINVAGHRLSTSTMEEIVSSHLAVAECAVVGVEDELRGQAPVGFVVLKTGENISEEQLEQELIIMVREKIGAVAFFRRTVLTKRLPKTRSGKTLRKIMRHIADGKSFSMPSTIEDVTVLDELRELMREKKIGVAHK